jgi:hypothetical protein
METREWRQMARHGRPLGVTGRPKPFPLLQNIRRVQGTFVKEAGASCKRPGYGYGDSELKVDGQGRTVGVWNWATVARVACVPVLLGTFSSASFSRSNAEDPKEPPVSLSRTSDGDTRGGSSVAQRAPHISSLNSRGLPVAPGNCPGIFGPEAVR